MSSREVPFDGLPPTEIKERVCSRGERPPLPPALPRAQQMLVEDCWQADGEKRPTFPDVAERLKDIR